MTKDGSVTEAGSEHRSRRLARSLRVEPGPVLSLAGAEPFAKGGYRHCYVHPDDADLCVKVVSRTDDRRCYAAQQMDIEDYAALRKRGPETVFDRIPEIKGVVDTDLGVGIVMRLYRDADGRISRNLANVIGERGLTPCLSKAIDEWKRWQHEQRLLTRDTAPYNMVAVHLGHEEWKLVIVEGWLNRRYRWLVRCHGAFANRLIGLQLRKFDRRVAKCIPASAAERQG